MRKIFIFALKESESYKRVYWSLTTNYRISTHTKKAHLCLNFKI
jgi:hypothetical protein